VNNISVNRVGTTGYIEPDTFIELCITTGEGYLRLNPIKIIENILAYRAWNSIDSARITIKLINTHPIDNIVGFDDYIGTDNTNIRRNLLPSKHFLRTQKLN